MTDPVNVRHHLVIKPNSNILSFKLKSLALYIYQLHPCIAIGALTTHSQKTDTGCR